MKGYVVSNGYMGYIQSKDKYMLFDTEDEYREYFIENEEES